DEPRRRDGGGFGRVGRAGLRDSCVRADHHGRDLQRRDEPAGAPRHGAAEPAQGRRPAERRADRDADGRARGAGHHPEQLDDADHRG
ncbi:MAG: hypothetical protein AVDCRST_MAG69-1963, partial [uncultured Solirubrobacteraceae bacterium]